MNGNVRYTDTRSVMDKLSSKLRKNEKLMTHFNKYINQNDTKISRNTKE